MDGRALALRVGGGRLPLVHPRRIKGCAAAAAGRGEALPAVRSSSLSSSSLALAVGQGRRVAADADSDLAVRVPELIGLAEVVHVVGGGGNRDRRRRPPAVLKVVEGLLAPKVLDEARDPGAAAAPLGRIRRRILLPFAAAAALELLGGLLEVPVPRTLLMLMLLVVVPVPLLILVGIVASLPQEGRNGRRRRGAHHAGRPRRPRILGATHLRDPAPGCSGRPRRRRVHAEGRSPGRPRERSLVAVAPEVELVVARGGDASCSAQPSSSHARCASGSADRRHRRGRQEALRHRVDVGVAQAAVDGAAVFPVRAQQRRRPSSSSGRGRRRRIGREPRAARHLEGGRGLDAQGAAAAPLPGPGALLSAGPDVDVDDRRGALSVAFGGLRGGGKGALDGRLVGAGNGLGGDQ